MKARLAAGIALIAVLVLAIAVGGVGVYAASTRYRVLSSFDFLSSDEVSNFENMTLAATTWNSTLTTYTVSSGQLNISNKDTSDALLVYPMTLNGYAEVTLSQGVIGIFNNYNGTSTVLTGYLVSKDSNGITVYEVNGTSKSAVASLTTSGDTVVITVMNGKLRIDLPDGTGIYEAPMDAAVIALGAPASDGSNPTYGVFDKVVLYGAYLSGQYEIDLGTKTVTPSDRIAEFSYDVSAYRDIRSAKLVIEFRSSNDPYARYYIVSTTDPGQVFWNPWPSSYIDFGVIFPYEATVDVDVTSEVTSSAKGTFYIGVSTSVGAWSVSAKLVIDAEASSTTTPSTVETKTGTLNKIKSYFKGENTKYLALGIGALALIILITLAMPGRRRGAAPLAAVLILLVIGGITAAVMAWMHPEYLTVLAFGLGVLAFLAIFFMIMSGKRIPNPLKMGE